MSKHVPKAQNTPIFVSVIQAPELRTLVRYHFVTDKYLKKQIPSFPLFTLFIVLLWSFSSTPLSAQITCETFNYTGSLQSYTVPEGISSIHIVAAGAQGGNETICGFCSQGGLGANTAVDFTVLPGQRL